MKPLYYKLLRQFFLLFLMSILLAPIDGQAISMLRTVDPDEYEKSAADFSYVGKIGECSGVLVAPDKFLTAAHCVDSNRDGKVDANIPKFVEFGADLTSASKAEFRAEIKKVAVHPLYNLALSGTRYANFDVAVVTLKTRVPSNFISASKYKFISAENPIGKNSWIFGYGLAGFGDKTETFYSPKRRGAQNRIDAFGSTFGPDNEFLTIDMDGPYVVSKLPDLVGVDPSSLDAPLPLEGRANSGDSGGPMMAPFGSDLHVVGVCSSSTFRFNSTPNVYGGLSYYTWLGHPETIEFLQDNKVYVIREDGFHPFSKSVPLYDGWRSSPRIGKFKPRSNGWTRIPNLGWIKVTGPKGKGFRAWKRGLGWFESSEDRFPFLLSTTRKSWLYYDQKNNRFWDYGKRVWFKI